MDDLIETSMLFEELAAQGSKKVAVVIGRFNPPTKGHYEVINQVKKFIRENKNLGLEASPVVIVIGGGKSDADKKRNPLSVDDRIAFMTASGNANGVTFFSASNAFAALAQLRDKDMEPIAIAAGSDRIDDYMRILDKHFTTPSGGAIKHHKIALDRDEDAVETKKDEKKKAMDSALDDLRKSGSIDTDLVSASLARRAVELDYFEEFAEIVGLKNLNLAKKMFNKIKAALGE